MTEKDVVAIFANGQDDLIAFLKPHCKTAESAANLVNAVRQAIALSVSGTGDVKFNLAFGGVLNRLDVASRTLREIAK